MNKRYLLIPFGLVILFGIVNVIIGFELTIIAMLSSILSLIINFELDQFDKE